MTRARFAIALICESAPARLLWAGFYPGGLPVGFRVEALLVRLPALGLPRFNLMICALSVVK